LDVSDVKGYVGWKLKYILTKHDCKEKKEYQKGNTNKLGKRVLTIYAVK
jgi:hypothetical protein